MKTFIIRQETCLCCHTTVVSRYRKVRLAAALDNLCFHGITGSLQMPITIHITCYIQHSSAIEIIVIYVINSVWTSSDNGPRSRTHYAIVIYIQCTIPSLELWWQFVNVCGQLALFLGNVQYLSNIYGQQPIQNSYCGHLIGCATQSCVPGKVIMIIINSLKS